MSPARTLTPASCRSSLPTTRRPGHLRKRKLASGHQPTRSAPHRPTSRCKSLNAKGISARIRRNRVGCKGSFEPFGRDWQEGTAAGASQNGIYLRLPGQWEEETWQEASSGAGIAYNVGRWIEPQIGRYTRPDPLGLSGDVHSYLYAQANPLVLIDPLGLKSRICCRKIPWLPASHCFIQIERNGDSTTCGLHGGRLSGGEEAGVGQIRGPNTFDDPDESDCGPWNEECGTDECVINTADNYANPSVYGAVSKSNSNSFAGHIARECSLTRPGNINRPRGWNRPPAAAKPGRETIPSPCQLPGQ